MYFLVNNILMYGQSFLFVLEFIYGIPTTEKKNSFRVTLMRCFPFCDRKLGDISKCHVSSFCRP